jgi:FtsP/CotA-like multicopper oxidase with cupredoxin domain
LSRRQFLAATVGVIASASASHGSRATATADIQITAESGFAELGGKNGPKTTIWGYDGQVPGPALRLRQGEPAHIRVTNKLDQTTTVHWHGIRLPIGMDGVPGISQAPIEPGQSFDYVFTPPDAGTFWYHPHANALEQLGHGLAGALIIEEREPVAVDRELLWMISDWRLGADGQIAPGFGNPMEAAMSGRLGSLVTLNGRVPEDQSVRAGERIRLRLVNGALARIMALRFAGHRPLVIAIDGQPCDPHEPADGRILLGPAMRIDLLLDMTGDPGSRYAVRDDFYDGLAYDLTQFAYTDDPPRRSGASDVSFRLPPNPLPEPELDGAERHEIKLQGGMMGGGMMSGMGGMNGMTTPGMNGGATWNINGMSMTGDGQAGMPPLMTLKRDRTHILVLENDTAWWHPLHFHGHSLRLLTRNGGPVAHRQWADTVLMAPKDRVECAFVADNPGDWMLHCHVMDHQVSGLMTILRIA